MAPLPCARNILLPAPSKTLTLSALVHERASPFSRVTLVRVGREAWKVFSPEVAGVLSFPPLFSCFWHAAAMVRAAASHSNVRFICELLVNGLLLGCFYGDPVKLGRVVPGGHVVSQEGKVLYAAGNQEVGILVRAEVQRKRFHGFPVYHP